MARIKILENINVYADCSFDSPVVGTAIKDSVLEYEEYINGWFRIKYHTWVHSISESGIAIEKTTDTAIGSIEYNDSFNLQLFPGEDEDGGIGQPRVNENINSDTSWSGIASTAKNEGIAAAVEKIADDSKLSLLTFSDTSALMGMPYQFLPTVDTRIIGGSINLRDIQSFGRKYAEKIGIRTPMLVMAPGLPSYLTGASNSEKEGLLSSLLDASGINNLGNKISATPPRYYTFKLATSQYFEYVNSMCKAAAMYLNLMNGIWEGLDEETEMKFMNNKINSSFKVDNVTTNFAQRFTSKCGYDNGVGFYINSDTQVSESISTSQTTSQLASTINGVSDMAREVQFIMGTGSDITGALSATAGQGMATVQNAVGQISKGFTGSKSLLNAVIGSMSNIIAGGKMIFPELWQDTQFSRSYQVNIKLTSPDNDNLSIFHNIIVPLMHLIAFALPRGDSTNSYISPFLVRAAYKSFFKIDMGMITDMSITRGAEGCWNQYGIPTTVDVNFTIKELYGIMNMAKEGGIFSNTSSSYALTDDTMLLDYIAGMCGVNLLASDITRDTVFKLYQKIGGTTNIPHTINNAIWDYLNTKAANLFNQI